MCGPSIRPERAHEPHGGHCWMVDLQPLLALLAMAGTLTALVLPMPLPLMRLCAGEAGAAEGAGAAGAAGARQDS